MAVQERLLPSLLDRITDDDPSRKGPESDRFSFGIERYREAVFRDLSWLLNSVSPARPEEIEGFPEVQSSVLNYGMPPLSGSVAAGMDPRRLQEAIREVVRRFEPRILPEGLRVTVSTDKDAMTRRALTFRVEGVLWSQPVPEHIYLRTELDLESGHVLVANLGSRGGD